MRILFIGLTPPLLGGAERALYNILKRMNKSDDVCLLTQRGSFCKDIKKIKCIEVPYISTNSIYLRNASFLLLSSLYALYLAFSKKWDIVNIHFSLSLILAPIFKIRKARIVATIQGVRGFRNYENKFFWFFYKILYTFSDAVTSVGVEDKAILADALKTKVVYLPNGVNTKIFLKIRIPEKRIIFFGRIHPQKGIIYLIKAFQNILSGIRDYNLYIVGEKNYYRSKLEEYVEKNRIGNTVFIDTIDDERQLAILLSSSYMIVLPSLFESLSLALLEGLATGRPVITTNQKTVRTIAKDRKDIMLVAKRSVKQLKRSMLYLIDNPKIADKIGNAGLDLAKKYDWDKVVAQYRELFKDIRILPQK